MEKDLLQTVIDVESEIHQSIESERKKASEWLESVRISLSREFEARQSSLEEEFTQSFEKKRRECEIIAEKEIADVNQLTEYLQNIPDEILQDIIREFLPVILPEAKR